MPDDRPHVGGEAPVVRQTDGNHIERIEAITKVARGNWFALIAALAFVGLTLLSARDIDFFDPSQRTELPAIGISVPITQFFTLAPIIIVLMYGFFHVYLIKLWAALLAAPALQDGTHLADRIPPWLISDFALTFRDALAPRDADRSKERRDLDIPAAIMTFVFTWVLGLVVVGAFWLRSLFVYRNDLAILSSSLLSIAILLSTTSLFSLIALCRQRAPSKGWALIPGYILVTGVISISVSHMRGEITLSGPNFAGTQIVARSDEWVPYAQTEAELIQELCKDVQTCDEFGRMRPLVFTKEVEALRAPVVSSLAEPVVLAGHGFRSGNFSKAFWPNAAFWGSGLTEADFSSAIFENAQFNRSSFIDVRFRSTNLQNANFSLAELVRTPFDSAHLQGANFSAASMAGFGIYRSNLQGADLRRMRTYQVTFEESDFRGADFSRSMIDGQHLEDIFSGANLSRSRNIGGALRRVDFGEFGEAEQMDWSDVFLDNSVDHEYLRRLLGLDEAPCQWETDEVLSDEEFFGRWRGWVEHPTASIANDNRSWVNWAPEPWRRVEPISPPEGCRWKQRSAILDF